MIIEQRKYPIGLVLPPAVSVAIRAKRCKGCGLVFFTNNSDFKKCENCNEI